MARKRRHRTTSKSSPPIIFAVLIFGVIASLFGPKDKSSEPPPASNTNAKLIPPTPAAEQPINSTLSKESEPGFEVASLPAPPPQAQVQTAPKPVQVTQYVIGRKVALRAGPGKSYSILDRYDSGRAVGLIETTGDWSRVRDNLTQREGWISKSLLGDRQPPPPPDKEKQKAQPEKKQQEVPTAPPIVSDNAVAQRLIAESIAMYPGTCACPYNTDRRGRSCGRRSAYSKGGGYAPLCYPQDVSANMIADFRKQAGR